MPESRAILRSQRTRLTIIAVSLTLFAIVLGIFTAGDNVLGSDLSLATWIQTWEGSPSDSLYSVGDVLGTTSVAAIVTGIALIIALARRHIQISAFLILVLVFRLLGTQLKPIFDSPRPTADHLRLHEVFDGTGYPSGHSTTVAMVAAMLVFIAWRHFSNSRLNWAITAISVLTVLLVGWSRVWSGAHWPSDVLGGWSFGFAMVIVAWMLSDAIASAPWFSRDTAAESSAGSTTPAK